MAMLCFKAPRMPPFGDEKEEAFKKPLPFLRSSTHDSQAFRTSVNQGPFGTEPAEKLSGPAKQTARQEGKSRPFQDEVEEKVGCGPRPSQPSRPMSVLWGAEPAEDGDVEPESASDGEDSDTAYIGTSQSVFSLGWHSLLDMKKASFWKENMDTATEKKKLKYNNTLRSNAAAYNRSKTEGAFKKNGVDPARLPRLTHSSSCQCVLLELKNSATRITANIANSPLSDTSFHFLPSTSKLPHCHQKLFRA